MRRRGCAGPLRFHANHTLVGAWQRVLSRTDPPHCWVETEPEFLVVPVLTGPESPSREQQRTCREPWEGPAWARQALAGPVAFMLEHTLHKVSSTATPSSCTQMLQEPLAARSSLFT